MKKKIDYSVYLVTDRGLARGRSTLEILQCAVRGGVTCVQLREKNCPVREFIEQANSIKAYLNAHDIPLIINDRLDVAQAVGADGVHLGQLDMPLTVAQDIVKDSMIIGISAESLTDAIEAEKDAIVFFLGMKGLSFTSILDQFHKVKGGLFKLDLSGLYLGQIKDVVYKLKKIFTG